MRVAGLIGLPNLGNTCYLNTAVQCVAHTPSLAHYFLSGAYKDGLNTESKITQGKVALEFSEMMKDLWLNSGEEKLITPGTFKTLVSRVDKRWKGFEQHDTEEFLSFLLSCLHDDLNRVKGRPPVKDIDSKQSDENLAKSVWEEELSRNNSVIDDLFKGLFRSKLVCPKCNLHATKFDPFYSVPVQIPVTSKGFHKINVTFVPPTGSTPRAFRIILPSTATVKDLRYEIAQANGISDIRSLFIAEAFDRFVRAYTRDDESITQIGEDEPIFAYHVTPALSNPYPSLNQVLIPVLQRCLIPMPSGPGGTYEFQQQIICCPFLIMVPRNIDYKTLHRVLEDRVKDFIYVVDVTPRSTKAPVAPKFSTPDEAIKAFEISVLNPDNNSPQRLLDLTENEPPNKITLGNDTSLFVDWCLQGFKHRRYKKREFGPPTTLSPNGGDETKVLKLTDCLRDFVKEEILSKHDTWYCPNCKEHQQASKAMSIWRAPKILRIDLKRFQNRGGFFFGQKLDKYIEYPLYDLDISTFVADPNASEPMVYDLYAVSRHLGWTAQSGHYTAFCKNNVDGKWYHFDDNNVSPVQDEKDIVTKDAYLLFYKRRDIVDPLQGEMEISKYRDTRSSL